VNTLKPLLIVAVLAGVGYGVYIRLNRGAGAPPPSVAEGWDTTPSVELPNQASAAPWGPSGAPTAAPTAPPAASQMAAPPAPAGDNYAQPYQPPVAAPAEDAPPFAQPAAGGEAPPVAAAPPPAADALAGSMPPQGAPTQPPGGSGYESAGPAPVAVPDGPTDPQAPPVDPYAESYESGPDRYRSPDPGNVPPTENPLSNSPPAAGDSPSQGELPPPPAAGGTTDFAAALDSARRELEGGQMATALRQLSIWYGKPGLSPDEQQQLNQLLDQVAGTVVYSTQHLLEPPYEVQAGERLEDIGEKYRVPWELLAKINGIDNPASLRPGVRLKVVRGPFEAVVSLQNRELTLLTGDGSYAGRFKIGIGGEHPPLEGTFSVSEKVVNPVYYGRDRAISAEDPANPLGERWIGLGKNLGIHGTNNPESIGRTDLPGSISLSQRDVEDVYDILSLGSRVTIRR
jgi:lipoprotein-anchoring transpeptidase ErfK/SrfK